MAGWLVTLCLLHVLGGAYGSSITPYYYGPGGLGGLLAGGGSVSNPSSCSGCGLDKMVTNCPLDVMFILDGSDSIPPRSFQQAQQYVVSQIQSVTAAFQGVNVGVLLFSDGVNRELPLQDRTPQQLTQLSAEVTQLKQPRMATELTATLRRARRALVDYGGLPLVPGGKRGKVIVLVSDGCDDEAGATKLEGVQATLDGIYIISVHVSGGSTAYMKVLTDLSQQVLEIRTPIDWSSVAACPAVFLPPRPAGSVCSNVVFAMDGSDSVRKWETVMRDYLAYTTIRYASVDNAIGVIVFGTNVATQSTDTMLPPTKDKVWLAEQIETHLRFPHSGGTGTTAAIQTATAMLGALGSNSVNTIVVVTDGPALNPETAREALLNAAASGYHVVVIGVGDVLTQDELQVMAGPGSTVLMVAGYLELFALDLGPQLCQAGPVCNTQTLQCSSTQITNLQTCSCACNLAYQCPSGQTLNPITCACAPRTCTLNCNNGRADANCQSCICNAGFTGPTCTSVVCTLVCRNGGALLTANNNCQCQCRQGYGGNDCSVCTQQCTAPQILDPASCTCRCNTGYPCPIGEQLDTSACTCGRIICNLNCGNGAADANCQRCICNQGFTGSDCSQRICTLSCGNGVPDATCQRCICNADYTGTFCTDRICTLNCNNGVRDANCQSCICNTGYTGTFCTDRICTLNCNNGVRDANCQSCICNTGYTGTFCTERVCTLNCNNGVRDTNCQSCICNTGYTGTYCTERVCTLNCNNGVRDTNCQSCICNTGYTGTYCTERICTLNCNNGARDANCQRCICNAGYTGTYCTDRICTLSCNNGAPDANCQRCVCYTGYTGTYCTDRVCTLNCNNGSPDSACTRCICNTGYTGTYCTDRICTLNCNNGVRDSSCTRCICNVGFTGTTCTACDPLLSCPLGQNRNPNTCICERIACNLNCNNNGIADSSCTTCICNTGYSGPTCAVRVCTQTTNCPSGTYFDSGSCTCKSGCAAQTLNCPSGTYFDTQTCTCKSGCAQTLNCPSGTYFDTQTCTCRSGCAQTLNCPLGTYFDTQTCTCKSGCAQTLNCGSGTYFDTLTCTCRPGCAQTLNCGSGQYFDTTTCTCRIGCAQTLNCAAGQYFDTTTCTCIPACTTVCSLPQQLDVINCVCRTPCNPQTVRCVNGAVDSTTCQCVCNAGYAGADCSVCSRQCNVGETLNPSSCICSRALCPNTCQNGGQMNQASCQCSCPAGFSGPSCENKDPLVSVETCSAAQSPCKNGGVAIKDCQGRCICKCDESRFAGVFCEIPATAELCNDCWNQNGQYLAGLPGRTDMYVVCQPLNVQRTRFQPWLMHCPPRTIFQRDPITGWFGCDHIGRGIPASDPCRNRTLVPAGKYASSDQCAHYFQCGSDGYTSKKACCPAGYRFDSSIGDCVADSNCPCVPDLDCPNSCNGSAGLCPVGRDQGASGPVCPYESMSGRGFYHRASPTQPYNCSVGQKFDSSPDVCRCVKDASQGCLPTVEADYIQGTNENPGYFSGSRREVFERFGGSGFHTDYFEIRLRLKLDRNFGTNNGEMAVVTNGDCGEKESVSITTNGNNVNFKVDGEQGELQQVSVPYSTPSDGWLQISLVYEKQTGASGTYLLTGTVNGQSNKLTVSGKIEMRMCALQIGKGFNYASLVGYVDDFQVWMCKPTTSG